MIRASSRYGSVVVAYRSRRQEPFRFEEISSVHDGNLASGGPWFWNLPELDGSALETNDEIRTFINYPAHRQTEPVEPVRCIKYVGLDLLIRVEESEVTLDDS